MSQCTLRYATLWTSAGGWQHARTLRYATWRSWKKKDAARIEPFAVRRRGGEKHMQHCRRGLAGPTFSRRRTHCTSSPCSNAAPKSPPVLPKILASRTGAPRSLVCQSPRPAPLRARKNPPPHHHPCSEKSSPFGPVRLARVRLSHATRCNNPDFRASEAARSSRSSTSSMNSSFAALAELEVLELDDEIQVRKPRRAPDPRRGRCTRGLGADVGLD